jgi:hypothetical protein
MLHSVTKHTGGKLLKKLLGGHPLSFVAIASVRVKVDPRLRSDSTQTYNEAEQQENAC